MHALLTKVKVSNLWVVTNTCGLLSGQMCYMHRILIEIQLAYFHKSYSNLRTLWIPLYVCNPKLNIIRGDRGLRGNNDEKMQTCKSMMSSCIWGYHPYIWMLLETWWEPLNYCVWWSKRHEGTLSINLDFQQNIKVTQIVNISSNWTCHDKL